MKRTDSVARARASGAADLAALWIDTWAVEPSITTNPGLLWRIVDLSHAIDYHQFALVEDDSEGPDPDEWPSDDGSWLASGQGWIALLSDGDGHLPTIALEAWSREPPPEQRRWHDHAEVEVEFGVETLRVWGTASGPSFGPSFVLPQSEDRRYRVRVYRRGDSETESVHDRFIALFDDGHHDDGVWGLEEWLFQFWVTGT